MSNTAREQIHHSKHLVFDSLSAKSTELNEQWLNPIPDPADFTINFKNSDFTAGQIISLLPVDIIIPNLFNNVTTRNNVFIFTDSASALIIITMPVGHYNVEEWCIEFTAQVAASASTVNVVSCAVNSITGQLEIQMNNNWSITFSIVTLFGSAGAAILLGLDKEQFINEAPLNSDGNNTITFANPPAFQGPQCVVIHSNFLTSSNSVLGPNHQQFTMVDFVSLADTCFGLSKHHFIRTDNVREIPFPASTNLNSLQLQLFDIDGTKLTLPSNAKVCYHFIASFGRDF